ncbi:AraC family transcriptional regulator [Paracoccus sp. PAR01]|uniref:AraC family transcriptional regulator n=1 Tax=Paracoccus sp. PAR01 TaxID=2769282 RepID=UPI00177FA116|nr:AraC family transcriptional regulator [Paracoccus sp. PAR01]MBD9527538.1 AraC family transcriptional regulator ligand-binding domain-containing protein [Paracoccus sp. PAR01]
MSSSHSRGLDHGQATIRAAALAPLAEFIAASTKGCDAFFASQGLPRTSISDPYAQTSLARYVDTFEKAADLISAPDLGLQIGMRIKPADLGPMGVLFSISPNLRVAFDRLSRHGMALQDGTQSSVYEVGPDLVWTYRLADISIWPRRQDAEYTLAAVCQLVRSSFSADWRPHELHFEHDSQTDRALLHRAFRAPVLYNQSANRIIFAQSDAARQYRAEDGGLAQILERHIGDLISQSRSPESISDQLRRIIGLWLGQRPITLATMAAELRMSPRSLQRRLSEEGTSLRHLLREHRENLAQTLLRQKSARVSNVANALGYADSTVFWRAFRNWTGQQPSAVHSVESD